MFILLLFIQKLHERKGWEKKRNAKYIKNLATRMECWGILLQVKFFSTKILQHFFFYIIDGVPSSTGRLQDAFSSLKLQRNDLKYSVCLYKFLSSKTYELKFNQGSIYCKVKNALHDLTSLTASYSKFILLISLKWFFTFSAPSFHVNHYLFPILLLLLLKSSWSSVSWCMYTSTYYYTNYFVHLKEPFVNVTFGY